MKKALGLRSDTVEIVPSEGYPWNAWEESDCGLRSFRTGLWWDVFEHLKKCRKCREELGISEKEIEEELKRIDEKWRDING